MLISTPTQPRMVDGHHPYSNTEARQLNNNNWNVEQMKNAKQLTAVQIERADKVIEALHRLWPSCFKVGEAHRHPLMIGMYDTLKVRLEPMITKGRISETDLKIALRRYTTGVGYLKACRTGKWRIDLSGHRSGAVTRKQAYHSRWLLRVAEDRAAQEAYQQACERSADLPEPEAPDGQTITQ
jgi:sRNA-binding protein